MYLSLTKFLRKFRGKKLKPSSLVFPILILSVIFRFYILFEFTPSCCGSDEGVYHSIAKHLVQENKFIFTQNDDSRSWTNIIYGAKPPLYPYFIASVYKVFGIEPTWVKIIQIIFISTLTGLVIYKITKKTGSESIALTALIIFSFFWETAHMSVVLMSESLYWLLLALFVYLLLKIIDKPLNKYAIYAGLTLGLLVLIRPPSLTFVLPTLLLLLLFVKFKAIWRPFAIMLFFLVISLIPWTLRNYNIYNKFVFIYTDGAINMWMGNYKGSGGSYNPPMANIPGQIPTLATSGPEQEVERDNYYSSLALDYIKAYPLDAMDIAVRKVFMTFSTYRPYVLNSTSPRGTWLFARPKSLGIDAIWEFIVSLEFGALNVFFFVGLAFVAIRRKFNPVYTILIIFFLWHLASIAATHYEPRYITHNYPLMIPLASMPIWYLSKSFRKFN